MIPSYRSVYLILLIGSAILFPSVTYTQSPSEFKSPSIHEILRFLDKSRQDISTLTQTRKLLKMNYDSLVYDIDGLKQNGDVGFFDRMQLKGILKESEDIANQLVKIDDLIKAHEDANTQKIWSLIELMQKEIGDSAGVLIFRHRIRKADGVESKAKLAKMLAEKKEFHFYNLKKFSMPVTEIRIQKYDEAEILFQKSDYLLDQTERLVDYSKELDRILTFLTAENKIKIKIVRLNGLLPIEKNSRSDLLSYFSDSILAFQRLPLSKALVTPYDDYETLIQRLSLEKDAVLSRIELYREESADIREMAEYKNRTWNK